MLSLDHFQELLDRWGDDLATWPPKWRIAARDLLANSDEARQRLEVARQLRRVIATPKAVRAPVDLSARILAAAAQQAPAFPSPTIASPDTALWGLLGRWLRTGVVMPACFVVGLMVGVVSSANSGGDQPADFPVFFQVLAR